MANTNLGNEKTAKNNEFYTQFADINKEMQAEMQAYLDYNPDVFRDKSWSSERLKAVSPAHTHSRPA